nr:hypothetical protein [Escherichia coli]
MSRLRLKTSIKTITYLSDIGCLEIQGASLPHSGCTKEFTAANRHNYPASSERYQLTDIDGEDAFIRIGSIAMVRVLLDAMKPVEEDDE